MGGLVEEFVISEDKKGNKTVRKIAVRDLDKRGIQVKMVETSKDKEGKLNTKVLSDNFYPDEKIHELKVDGKSQYEITGGL